MDTQHAPHTVTLSIRLSTFFQRATGEFLSADTDKTLLLSLPCRNLQESQRAKEKLIEALETCIRQVKSEMLLTKQT